MADGLSQKLSCLFSSSFSQMIRFSWTLASVLHTSYIFFDCVTKSIASKPVTPRNTLVSEVLFFPDKKLPCRKFISRQDCPRDDCPYAHEQTSLGKLIGFIIRAKHTLDVCVFTINCHELANSVVELHKLGVVVRVLTDDEQMGSTGSQIEKFRREGIQVRHDLSSFFMHHKFVIIDGEVLANGSFNWTRQAVTGNCENVVITNDKRVVAPFVEEFNKLWLEYDPKRR